MVDRISAADFRSEVKVKRPARNKYGAKRTTVGDATFDSGAEARRYTHLKIMEDRGLIRGLELQPTFPILVNGKKCGVYKSDFRYWPVGPGAQQVIEDVKGGKATRTAVYRLKKKLVEAIYGITITEIG